MEFINNKFENVSEYNLIYIFRINDKAHKGALKIGETTIKTDKHYSQLNENCADLNYAAKKRIDQYTLTAGIKYELLHTEIAVYNDIDKADIKDKELKNFIFRDHDVHKVLLRSGINKKGFYNNKSKEWFECKLEIAIKAIKTVKERKSSLDNKEVCTNYWDPIDFRPEQLEAIETTVKRFKKSIESGLKARMLWNAKMRFGKTVSALEVVKKLSFSRTIIISHRPVVKSGWKDDFSKVFNRNNDYEYGSKEEGKTFDELNSSNKKFIYFSSMQDLRGSKGAGGKHEKNDAIFESNWDFLIIDEAHEGIRSSKGKDVIELIEKNNPYIKKLELSGTAFGIIDNYTKDEIFTWDYIMEQEAKSNWIINNFGDHNPYWDLPKLNIYTYSLDKIFTKFIAWEDKAFNFSEFFRTWTGDVNKDNKKIPDHQMEGDFVYEKDIKSFLNLISKTSKESNYPFSTKKYQEMFKHTLWMLPGVKEAKALSKLLKEHEIFGQFEIVNVAGDGDEEINTSEALNEVKKAIKKSKKSAGTITLSCGRLTTGVTIPEWTAVLMLYGKYSTSAIQYLQTIFRVQSPGEIEGKLKTNCYVFDFAPDRALKLYAEWFENSLSINDDETTLDIKKGKFLNFVPFIAIDGSSMTKYNESNMYQALKKVYAEQVVRSGFDNKKLYNDQLLKLDNIEYEKFKELQKIVGNSSKKNDNKDVIINNQGLNKEELERIKKLRNKRKKDLTDAEKEELKKLNDAYEKRRKAISILRGISVRIPLMVFGAEIPIEDDITIEKFPDLVDDVSWEEFMPNRVTKEMFKEFSKYYDAYVFSSAVKKIRIETKIADELEPLERVKKISELFATFKNPDKETVLTPWRVVNMHMSRTIGGYNFYDQYFNNTLTTPLLIKKRDITDYIFHTENRQVLDINSKTGLYPLYLAYSFYMYRLSNLGNKETSQEQKLLIWDDIVEKNIYAICKTPMAKSITKRTLVGYRNKKINAQVVEDIIKRMKDKNEINNLANELNKKVFWNKEGNDKMKFNAIVGNPPYHIIRQVNTDKDTVTTIYHLFYLASLRMNPNYVSMIIPSRWMTGGKGLDDFRRQMFSKKSFITIHDHFETTDCFANVEIKGGVCYFLASPDYADKIDYYFYKDGEVSHSKRKMDELDLDLHIRDSKGVGIVKKIVTRDDFKTFESIVSVRKPFGIESNFSDYVDTHTHTHTIKIYGWRDSKPYTGYISKHSIKRNIEIAYKWKVIISKASGVGNISTDKIIPKVINNNSVATETYLVLGEFNNEKQADNLASYINTKFFHFLLGQIKNTQNMTRKEFKLIPLVNFRENWNDQKLYKKFGLTQNEIEIIESSVWPENKTK
ncbi:hypothetical protein CJJ23_02875 [Mycoplasmopsis agassizii]|uniref:Helicase ATP-binding domain-containing protein n=1 Tax=Mycoplasmopsis agassizii TaxID=33922 RepID=A0A269TJR1_9BACT|nr:Eco57I restriction-modification methylase domain-containing protein [Mycoplasmopsis agassizii]PAK21266.1 hypothetical protein CJJ23_02875 [Mycoplasmopsis agassizii]